MHPDDLDSDDPRDEMPDGLLTYKEFIQVVQELEQSALSERPTMVLVHPTVWNGYWIVDRTIPVLRWLGRKLKNKYIYWLGFQIQWIVGLKEYVDTDAFEVDVQNML